MSRKDFDCGPSNTIKDIARRASFLAGHTVSETVVRNVRAKMAQAYCDKYFDDAERGCIGNPWLPQKQAGNAYLFKPARARRLLRAVLRRASEGHARGAALRAAQRREQVGV